MILDAIDEQHAENEEQELEKIELKENPFLESVILFHVSQPVRATLLETNRTSPGVPLKQHPTWKIKNTP